jgi:hypothetical protein
MGTCLLLVHIALQIHAKTALECFATAIVAIRICVAGVLIAFDKVFENLLAGLGTCTAPTYLCGRWN